MILMMLQLFQLALIASIQARLILEQERLTSIEFTMTLQQFLERSDTSTQEKPSYMTKMELCLEKEPMLSLHSIMSIITSLSVKIVRTSLEELSVTTPSR